MFNSAHRKQQKQKNGDRDEKALCKLMNNAVYGKNGKRKKQNRCKTCK